MDHLRTVSLFSGCGGSDLGAARAGADVVFAIDKARRPAETYRTVTAPLVNMDVQVSTCDIAGVVSLPQCDLVIGCYPCQSFSMGGPRDPRSSPDHALYKEFARCVALSNPRYLVMENVAGLFWINGGSYFRKHIDAISAAGRGYHLTYQIIDARDYGVPAARKRMVVVGVRDDIDAWYWFPPPTHGKTGSGMLPWESHGDAIASLWDDNAEYYDHRNPFPWYYMSRNRKRRWEEPGFAVQGNWRHVTLHPASPTMKKVESNLANGSKQRWVFTANYEHLGGHPERPWLNQPRRLTWRECAVLQTFPAEFEPVGSVQSKYRQIGNAVPPRLMETIVAGITTGSALVGKRPTHDAGTPWPP